MLSDAAIRAAIRAGGNKTLTDGGKRGSGRLLLVLRPGVHPEWYAAVWSGGKKKTAKLGTFPELSLSGAREKFKSGGFFDRPAKAGTLAELIDQYVADLKAQNKRSAGDIERTLQRMAERIGLTRQANKVTTADVIEALRPVYAAGKPAMADHMRSAIRAAYSWAIRAQNDYRIAVPAKTRFDIGQNPAANIPTEPKVAGDRWLDRDELLAFWTWLRFGSRNENRNTDPRNLVALQVMILTGQRVEEILRIHTSMVNRRLRTIEWPVTKTGNSHVIPATDKVLRRLTWCRNIGEGLYFPRFGDPSQPVDTSTIRSAVMSYCRQTGAPHFSTRDLRRTWKTLAGSAGLTKTERDMIQNHAHVDVSSKHYDRYDYMPEKRQTLEKWERWLLTKKESPE